MSNFTSNVYPPFKQNRDKNGGRKFSIFIKRGLIAKRLHALEDSTSQTICLVVAISKKKWCVTFAYRPPYNSNKDGFFRDLNKFLSNITRKYEKVWEISSIQIFQIKKISKIYLSDLFLVVVIYLPTFSLSNLISGVICVKSSVVSSIDMIIINRPRNFHYTTLIETGMSIFISLYCHYLELFLNEYPRKLQNIATTANSVQKLFSTNQTKNSNEVSSTVVKITV